MNESYSIFTCKTKVVLEHCKNKTGINALNGSAVTEPYTHCLHVHEEPSAQKAFTVNYQPDGSVTGRSII